MAPARAASSPTFSPSTPSATPKTGVKFAVAPRPVATARITRRATAATFATVKTFWTRAPARRPVTFSQVRAPITTSATAWAVENTKRPAEKSTLASPIPGRKKPRFLAKATDTAATKPVLIASRNVQP